MNSVPQSVLMHRGLPIFCTNERKASHASLCAELQQTDGALARANRALEDATLARDAILVVAGDNVQPTVAIEVRPLDEYHIFKVSHRGKELTLRRVEAEVARAVVCMQLWRRRRAAKAGAMATALARNENCARREIKARERVRHGCWW